MEVIFLGTAGSIPTKQRNHSAILVKCDGFDILLDCGEGTQRQMKIEKLSPHRLKAIFISHWHADHTLGLAGILGTLSQTEFKGEMHIYGPENSAQHIDAMKFAFHLKPMFSLMVHDISKKTTVNLGGVSVTMDKLKHGITCLGFRIKEDDKRKMNLSYLKKQKVPQGPHWGKLQRGKDITVKGKKITVAKATIVIPGKVLTYIADTLPCDTAVKLAKDADLMISEATFDDVEQAKAKEYRHLTGTDAATMAKKAKAKSLVLTHFSQRYISPDKTVKEAKKVFAKTKAAKDFMHVKV